MRKGSLIDDVQLYHGDRGPPICFKNADIRNLLKLGKAGPEDVFFDIGSGWGQTILIALTEFGVKRAVGFEKDSERWKTANLRREKWLRQRWDIRPDQWHLMKADFEKLFKTGTIAGESLKDATLIFYGLTTSSDILRAIKKAWKGTEGRRLLYYHNCLFPEILPSKVDQPFFVSKFPFTRPVSEEEWLTIICGKRTSSLIRGGRASKQELWDELSHDYDLDLNQDDIGYYKGKVTSSVKRRMELGSAEF
jgi:Histone methylation protein DOT1